MRTHLTCTLERADTLERPACFLACCLVAWGATATGDCGSNPTGVVSGVAAGASTRLVARPTDAVVVGAATAATEATGGEPAEEESTLVQGAEVEIVSVLATWPVVMSL